MVLIIEDSHDISCILSLVLGHNNIRSISFASGREGFDWLQKNECSLLVLDYNTRDITGEKVIALMRKHRIDVPIIMITGYDLAEMDGVECILRKPFPMGDFLAVAKKYKRRKVYRLQQKYFDYMHAP